MKHWKILHSLLFFFIFAVPLAAQNSRPQFNRAQTFDVQHYALRVKFNRVAKKVLGDTTVQIKPLAAGFSRLELDAVDLDFESVRLEPGDKDLQYRVSDDKIYVTLDKAYSPDETVAVRFRYSATPKKGVYFVGEDAQEGGRSVRSAQIWTQGEPEEARHWFPSFDFPSDKATTEQFITVEAGETAIGNGELLAQTANADSTTTFHYKMPVPHSTYLVSFVVGKYAKVTDSYKNVPLGFYVYLGRESIAPKAFGNTKEMMRVFEELTGVDFPFNKYDQTIVSGFNFGGMENITATTMADTEIFFANFNPQLVGDLVSHELAHSWFGNLVTCKNWAELWLNEGFATFMEAAFRERMYGSEDYMRKIRQDAQQFLIDDVVSKNRHALYNRLARPDDSLFDTTTYQKGGAVIHTLRQTIGEEAFWKAVNIYLNRHKFGNVETADLQKAMEEASGKNLDWFFKQWVYGAGSPKLDVNQVYNPKTKTLRVAINQVQKLDDITPAVFILPMTIEIKTGEQTRTENIEVKRRQEVLSFKVAGKPTALVFDKEEKIPLKTIKINPLR